MPISYMNLAVQGWHVEQTRRACRDFRMAATLLVPVELDAWDQSVSLQLHTCLGWRVAGQRR